MGAGLGLTLELTSASAQHPRRRKRRIAEVIVRKPAPVLATTPDEEPMELSLHCRPRGTNTVLSVIRQQTLSIEQKPGTYEAMREEKRRHVILDALNTHYRGAGTAEGFNYGGKADILVRHEGRNLFIAESKSSRAPRGSRKHSTNCLATRHRATPSWPPYVRA